jgi:hypothetical protein
MRVTCQKTIIGKDEREPVLKATGLTGLGISHSRKLCRVSEQKNVLSPLLPEIAIIEITIAESL